MVGNEVKAKKERVARPFPPTTFCAYYEPLALDAADHASMLEAMGRPLPIAFRAAGDAASAAATAAEIEARFGSSSSEPVTKLRPLPWRPGAWRLECSRQELRGGGAELRRMHAWLVSRHEVGIVRRQEEASMLSVALLGAEPGERIVDTCASPGSKASELADRLGERGLLLANDNDLKRCWMLMHTMLRFPRPTLVVCHHEAQRLPALPEGFDRVLCDVPCSGDGTLRKAKSVWQRKGWKPTSGASLHPLQLAIARRGLAVLRPGGTLLYSTCSLNPIENEAVVAALLANGGCELLEAKSRVPGLSLRPGINAWRVANQEHPFWKQQQTAAAEGDDEPPMWFASVDEAREAGSRAQSAMPSMYPPSPDSAIASQLHRCARLLPQDNDTGGFFAAVFRKFEAATDTTNDDDDDDGGGGGGGDSVIPAAAMRGLSEPLPVGAVGAATRKDGKHLDLPHAVPTSAKHTAPLVHAAERFPVDMGSLAKFFGLEQDGTAGAGSNTVLMSRSAEELHRVYAVSREAAVAVLLDSEDNGRSGDEQAADMNGRRYEVVGAGAAVFQRARAKGQQGSAHRLCSDAQLWGAKYLPQGEEAARTLWLELDMWQRLIHLSDPKHAARTAQVLGESEDGARAQARVQAMGSGSVLLRLRNGCSVGSLTPETALIGWLGATTLMLFSNKDEIAVLKELYPPPTAREVA